jgi:hypothetical protein
MQKSINIYKVLKGYFDNSKNYYVFDTERKEKVKINNLEIYGYFMSGFQDERDTGKLATLWNCNQGTCLLYVTDENDNEIVVKEYAGEEIPDLMKRQENTI